MAKSEYLQREEAAKKQLGTKGVKKRVKQLPTAARASLREMTGIDVSRKGVSVDPGNVALAAAGFIPFGKSLSVAAKVLKPASKRIASATKRVVARNKSASEAMDSRYREKFTESLNKKYEAKDMLQPKSVGSETYVDRSFTDWSGGVDRAGNSRNYLTRLSDKIRNRNDVVVGKRGSDAFGVTEEYYQLPSSQTRRQAYTTEIESSIAAREASRAASEASRIRNLGRDTTAGAAAEIKRRLAALKSAKRNR